MLVLTSFKIWQIVYIYPLHFSDAGYRVELGTTYGTIRRGEVIEILHPGIRLTRLDITPPASTLSRTYSGTTTRYVVRVHGKRGAIKDYVLTADHLRHRCPYDLLSISSR